jgi:acetyl-CoA acetyltransferase
MTNGAAIVGVGGTPFYSRGASLPRTVTEMAAAAILDAARDAGIGVRDIDGFAYYSSPGMTSGLDAGRLVETLGIPEVRFDASVNGGGGGAPGSVGLARMAVLNRDAKYVVIVYALQQSTKRIGAAFSSYFPVTTDNSFYRPTGIASPGQCAALMTRRHMHRYGTSREAFAEVAISTRLNATTMPSALMREPLTRDQYFAARMIAEPLCLFDYCLETDGAVAVIVAGNDRAADLAQRPVHIMKCVQGFTREWGRVFWSGNSPDEVFASSGMQPIAKRLFDHSGITPADVDVALLYDHFTPFVVMQLEDFGFCPIGEGGPFVQQGSIRVNGGVIPVNPHGGHLSEAYMIGLTHIVEAVRQIRGTAVNQIRDAEVALVSGGPGPPPLSAMLLRA